MRMFSDKEVKLLFAIVGVVLLGFIFGGQVTAKLMADDYKKNMVSHDCEVAGYLYRSNLDKSLVSNAFISDKSKLDLTTGQKLLNDAGYSSTTKNSLLPEVASFHQKYALLLLVLSLAFSVILISILLFFTARQNKRLEKAGMDILSFMDGNTAVRLDDHEEGSLSRLFTSVNAMATSLTSHIIKEKQNKEFLKDTISDISHQLKTPLAALKMYNEIIRDENTGNDVVDNFSSKSQREITRMEVLILNLLKLARLDSGTIELKKNTCNLKRFLEEIIDGFSTRAEFENKEITLSCDEHVVLSFDEEWMMEAISNIIKNSLDHTGAGGRIEVQCSNSPVFTQITVKDNGTGIHPEDIHHIFKRFYRSRFSKDKQGAGIGLTISKAIIEKHGGTITVESELSKGVCFSLAFPKLSNL